MLDIKETGLLSFFSFIIHLIKSSPLNEFLQSFLVPTRLSLITFAFFILLSRSVYSVLGGVASSAEFSKLECRVHLESLLITLSNSSVKDNIDNIAVVKF